MNHKLKQKVESIGCQALLPLLGVDTSGCEELYITVPVELSESEEWMKGKASALQRGLEKRGLVYQSGPFIREVQDKGQSHYIVSVFGKPQNADNLVINQEVAA